MAPPISILQKSLEDLEQQIELYFKSRVSTRKVFPRDKDPYEEEYIRPPTFTGIANAIGISRMTLWRYVHRREDLDEQVLLVLTRACDRVQEMIEEATFNRETYQGARFNLEVNHRWGREDEGSGASGTFQQAIISPVAQQTDQPLAIPKWTDD